MAFKSPLPLKYIDILKWEKRFQFHILPLTHREINKTKLENRPAQHTAQGLHAARKAASLACQLFNSNVYCYKKQGVHPGWAFNQPLSWKQPMKCVSPGQTYGWVGGHYL